MCRFMIEAVSEAKTLQAPDLLLRDPRLSTDEIFGNGLNLLGGRPYDFHLAV